MKTISVPDGERVPVLGQGTWGMGESRRAHAEEVDNARSVEIELTKEDLADLDRELPAPRSKQPLPTL